MRRRAERILLLCLALTSVGCPGQGRTPLNPTRLTSGAGDKSAPDFSPDGKAVVFARRTADNETHLFVIELEGRRERQLTFVPSMNGEPAWSHDGTRIAFQSNRDGKSNVYVVAADAGEKPGGPPAQALTREAAYSGGPAWSPDDRRIAFESDRGGNFDIYVMNADGDNAHAITYGPTHDTTPAWSPDGLAIAFSSERTGNRDLWMMNPDGSLPRRLTTDPAAEWRPRWTPNSRQMIYMRSETPGVVEFYEVFTTVQQPKQVVASAESIRDPVVSPDGKWLVFSANREGTRDIHLLKLRE